MGALVKRGRRKVLDLRADVLIGDTVRAYEVASDRVIDGMVVARGVMFMGSFISQAGGGFALIRGLGVVNLQQCISWAPNPRARANTTKEQS